MSQFSRILPRSIRSNGKGLSFERPVVMGILNLTPDSFYDGGSYVNNLKASVNRAAEMLDQGATIIDVGAASTRPGAQQISPQEEWERLQEPLQAIRKQFPETWISVDTYHSVTAQRALDAGADIVNDISAAGIDPVLWEVVAKKNCPYVLMHMQGTPLTMQANPHYHDVVNDLMGFFSKKLKELREMKMNQIIIDPGFGFGKSLEHNYTMLKHLYSFKEFGFPLMVGISRKSMVTRLLGVKPEDALNGTTALHMLALQQGADILRVHDVKEAAECIRIFMSYQDA